MKAECICKIWTATYIILDFKNYLPSCPDFSYTFGFHTIILDFKLYYVPLYLGLLWIELDTRKIEQMSTVWGCGVWFPSNQSGVDKYKWRGQSWDLKEYCWLRIAYLCHSTDHGQKAHIYSRLVEALDFNSCSWHHNYCLQAEKYPFSNLRFQSV